MPNRDSNQTLSVAIVFALASIIFGAIVYWSYNRSTDIFVSRGNVVGRVVTITQFPFDGEYLHGTEKSWKAIVDVLTVGEVEMVFYAKPSIGRTLCIERFVRESGVVVYKPGAYIPQPGLGGKPCAI